MFFFENGGQTLWEDLFHASNGKAQASTQGSLLCSLFKFWGRVWGFGGGGGGGGGPDNGFRGVGDGREKQPAMSLDGGYGFWVLVVGEGGEEVLAENGAGEVLEDGHVEMPAIGEDEGAVIGDEGGGGAEQT